MTKMPEPAPASGAVVSGKAAQTARHPGRRAERCQLLLVAMASRRAILAPLQLQKNGYGSQHA